MNTTPTSSAEWAPFALEPMFVGRVWGFSDLRPWYDRVTQSEPIGEVWLTGDRCMAATGPHSGRLLGQLFEQSPAAMLGDSAPASGSPLLIKTIFAREKLSVQVHPDDALAQKYGFERGKTECWYALDAEPGAQVACGLKPGLTLGQVRAEIESGTLEQSLNLISVSTGDLIFVDAGTVHAIWPGSILLEVQQNCDITYRLYDYGRPRELHIDKGLEATQFSTHAGKVKPEKLVDRTVLIDSNYFAIERIPITGARPAGSLRSASELSTQPGLSYLFAASGVGRISGTGFAPVELLARAIVCVPASAPDFVVEDLGGLDLIRITPRWNAGQIS